MASRLWVGSTSLVAAGALLLAGCGAGQDAPTAQDLPSVPGVNVSRDGIAVRNANVPAGGEYEVGGIAPITFSLVNETDAVIRLESATSELAATVEAAGGGTVAVPAFELRTVILEATGLTTALDATVSLPLELTFDNDVAMSFEVPLAPPDDPGVRGEPLDVGHH